MTPIERKLLLLSLSTVIIGGSVIGAYYFARSRVRNVQIQHSERQGMQFESPANHAKRLKMAFDNDNAMAWGTDEEAVFQVFREMPTQKHYSEVQRDYKRLYAKELNSDLQNELDQNEMNTVLAILNHKPMR